MRFTDFHRNDQFAILAFAVFLGFAAFFGSAPQAQAGEPVRFSTHGGTVIAEYAEPCPNAQAAMVEAGFDGRLRLKAPPTGCYDKAAQAIYYPVPEDREHELQHADGMTHGPWSKMGGDWPWMCARVTVSGQTHWRVGETICRTPRGEYVSGGA